MSFRDTETLAQKVERLERRREHLANTRRHKILGALPTPTEEQRAEYARLDAAIDAYHDWVEANLGPVNPRSSS